jgi:hypothetical protein
MADMVLDMFSCESLSIQVVNSLKSKMGLGRVCLAQE